MLFVVCCLLCLGYRLSPQAMNCVVKRYSTHGKITFDDYVACCVRLRSLTGEYDLLDRLDFSSELKCSFALAYCDILKYRSSQAQRVNNS